MFSLLCVGILCLASQCMAETEEQIKYYEDLIRTEKLKSAIYRLPTKNVEFEQGSRSDVILDYGIFDFIIVGAGSAGSVLATRLSEESTFSILLLEAGGEETDFSDIPSMFAYSLISDMNWGYLTKPQKTCCLAMKHNRCTASRGKGIGGSSTVNTLMYVRGNKRDFDKWEALGNFGWSYRHVLPYFKKSENSLIVGDRGYHGEGGLWNVEYHKPSSGTFQNFVEANEEMNRKYVDYNGRHNIGFSKTQHNTKNGKRASLGRAFLQGARNRTNLNVITKALVTKIIIEKNSAEGIIFVKGNKKYMAKAAKEVILSAGAFNSPQLLMISGIGPRKHLKKFNIPVLTDLPVGQNLYDHPNLSFLSFHTNYTVQDDNLADQIDQYLRGEGPLTLAGDSEALGFIQTELTPLGVPSVEYIYFPSRNSIPLANKVSNLGNTYFAKYAPKATPMRDISILLMLLHPKSKGSVTLQSKDPIDFPVIDYNYFSDPGNQDIKTFIKGIDFVFQLIQQPAFQKINAEFISLPICKEFPESSKRYWECVLRHTASTQYHPCGTTRMGIRKKTSVVNSDLKVHGIKKLRVVDAGVFPSTVSGHLNAVVVMIAEKISDDIKREHTFRQKLSDMLRNRKFL